MRFNDLAVSTRRIAASGAVEPLTLEAVKLNSRVSGNTEDALLTRLLTSAREVAEGACMRSFIDTEITLSMPCFPEGQIPLYFGFVREVSEVSYMPPLGGPAIRQQITISTLNVDLNGRIGVLSPPSTGWPDCLNLPGSVIIKYKAGPKADDTKSVPVSSSVQTAMLLLIEHMYTNRSATVQGMITDLPYGVEAFLDRECCGFFA